MLHMLTKHQGRFCTAGEDKCSFGQSRTLSEWFTVNSAAIVEDMSWAYQLLVTHQQEQWAWRLAEALAQAHKHQLAHLHL